MACAFALKIQVKESPEVGNGLGEEGRGKGWWDVAEVAQSAGWACPGPGS